LSTVVLSGYAEGMQHRLLADPFIAAEIDDALAAFVGRLAEDRIEWMRHNLALACENDPHLVAALKGAYPRHAPGNIDASGERVQPALDDPGEVLELRRRRTPG
jgi:hypothetical protein